MNQEKIGRFIASCRKECGYTQASLGEKLGITDRAVLLWSSFFVTLLANKIELFRTNTSAVSATLDNAPAGWMLSSLRL